MTFENYTEQRNALVTQSEELLNEDSLEVAQAKMKEIEVLDAKFEEVKLNLANLNALKNQTKTMDLENLSVENKGDLTTMTKFENIEMNNEKVYENAFAKTLLGKELTAQENTVYSEMNNHTTSNTSAAIPNTTLNEVLSEIYAENPFFGDARKLNIKGNVELPKHVAIVSGDASKQVEGTPTPVEKNTFAKIQLTGHEVAKYIEVSFKLDAMSVPALLEYLKQEIVERVGAELGRQSISGNGTDEMKGVLTALSSVTSQQTSFAIASGLTYEKVTEAIGKLGSKHVANAAFYANNTTVWNLLANVKDETGRPFFIADTTDGGVGRAFGFPVKVDSAVPVNTIILGDAKGYAVNTNEPVSVETARDIKARKTGFSAYTILDGDVTHEKAFSIIAPSA